MTAGSSTSPVFDFSSLDYASMLPNLEAYAQSTFPNSLWTDFNPSDPGVYFLEQMCYLSDLLAYGLNSYAQETVLVTAVKRQNAINILQSLDYTLASASAASGNVDLIQDPSGTYPYTLSSHVQFTDISGQYYFQPVATESITGSGFTIAVINGREYYLQNIGTTNGQANQQFQLQNSPLIDNTLSVLVGATPYTLVENAIEAGPTDDTYTLAISDLSVATITFGDGINGTIPPSAQTVYATYKIGGGLATNLAYGVSLGVAGTSDGSLLPVQLFGATVDVNDAGVLGFTGGGEEQSLLSAQQNAPLALKANYRAVAVQDYTALAVANVANVFQAVAVPGRPYAGSNPVLLVTVPQGGGYPDAVLINQILIAFIPFKPPGKRIIVTNPVYVQLAISIDAYVIGNSSALAVSSSINTTINNAYAFSSSVFAEVLDLQTAYSYLQPSTIAGLQHALYTQFSVVPYYAAHLNSAPIGNGDIENITTVNPTRREWLCRVMPADPVNSVFCSRFVIWERQLGTISLATDTLLVDNAANYTPNGLLGSWYVRPNPDINSGVSPTEPNNGIIPPAGAAITYQVTGNTQTSINVAGNLLAQAAPGDPYVVEHLNANVGKILRTTVISTSVLTTSTSITVSTTLSFKSGDQVIVWSLAILPQITTVVTVTSSSVLLLAAAVTVINGVFVDFYWTSDNGSVSFSMIDGTQVSPAPALPAAFAIGDELYVDVYPATGDLNLRTEAFPLITPSNVVITTIGGI